MFILGAYPSALHVAWRPPAGKPVRAMAVDNEPVPFWNGEREGEYIAQWKAAVGFRAGEWGTVAAAGKLNGSSGIWVDDNVLAPLGAGRDDVCISDCLDTYFSSDDGAARVADTYQPFAEGTGLPPARLAGHFEFDLTRHGMARWSREVEARPRSITRTRRPYVTFDQTCFARTTWFAFSPATLSTQR